MIAAPLNGNLNVNICQHSLFAARQAKDSELIQYATEIKVRAERRCGELLATAEKNTGARGIGTSAVERSDSTPPTLKQMGLTRDESSRYQQLAAIAQRARPRWRPQRPARAKT